MSRYATELEPDITIVSDKGQVVIPASMRNKLGLKPRSKLLVYAMDDAIVLKKLRLPDMKKEMRSLWKEVDANIEKYGGMTEREIQEDIEKYRSKKKGI
ncbi:MAG TPA: AbrB/MazE/SpoVT family DNA-binding domain-containing protein [Nitrososphaerales archaeon]|nr:AbrB/MazE/SpoVT family DNA-binding domain-containing protein [Nitrososphaerales archaeon]